MQCPYCRKSFDPREAMAEAEWYDIISLIPEFGPYSKLAMEYCELFGVTPLRIKSKKLLRLLNEVAALFRNESFTFQKKQYRISRAGIAEALRIVCNKHFEQPLENHNYLKKVMIGIAEREAKEQSIRREKELRRKEERIMAGAREEGGITLEEYKRSIGVKSLADIIGMKTANQE